VSENSAEMHGQEEEEEEEIVSYVIDPQCVTDTLDSLIPNLIA
jgi:hypothetical protein